MALAFIGLGSNLGQGRDNLLAAWKKLAATRGITCLTLSSPYLTEPVGVATENWFTNAVGAVETRLEAEELLACLLEIETRLGRDRSLGQDRIIDLDLLYHDDLVISSPGLSLPHPEIANRLFVLAPLAEIAPDHRHPLLGLSSRRMLQNLVQEAKVKKQGWQGDKT